jgi:hypothetical protein
MFAESLDLVGSSDASILQTGSDLCAQAFVFAVRNHFKAHFLDPFTIT